MVQNDIANIGIFTLEKYRGMMDHLGSGKEWDLDRSNGGLYIFPPALSQDANEFRGDLSNFHLHRDFFLNGTGALVTGGSAVLRRLQTGSVRTYAGSLFVGVVVVLGYYLWR